MNTESENQTRLGVAGPSVGTPERPATPSLADVRFKLQHAVDSVGLRKINSTGASQGWSAHVKPIECLVLLEALDRIEAPPASGSQFRRPKMQEIGRSSLTERDRNAITLAPGYDAAVRADLDVLQRAVDKLSFMPGGRSLAEEAEAVLRRMRETL